MVISDDDTRTDPSAKPPGITSSDSPTLQDRATVIRDGRLLAFLLTLEVLEGKRILDTRVDIADGATPFDATSEVIAAMCDQVDRQSIEVASLLRREGWLGTVEALLQTASYLGR